MVHPFYGHLTGLIFLALMVSSCTDKGDDDDGSAGSGPATIYIDGLVDSTGVLSASTTFAGAEWSQSDSFFELWRIDRDANELIHSGDAIKDSLSLSTKPRDCAAFDDLLVRSADLVAGLSGDTPIVDICDGIDAFMALEKAAGADASPSLYLGAYVDDLLFTAPEEGTFGYSGVSASLSWRAADDTSWDAWNADACTFEHPENPPQAMSFSLVDAMVQIDSVTDQVTGTLWAELDPSSETSGSIEAIFEADLCSYSSGPVVLALPW